MNCFYHPDKPAIGLCKYCQRGLCIDVIACKHRHEDEVRQLGQLAARNLFQSKRISSSYMRNAIFYSLVGALFTGFGIMQYRFLGWQAVFFMMIGLFLLYAASANYFEGRKHK
jgi:hypothetical protein